MWSRLAQGFKNVTSTTQPFRAKLNNAGKAVFNVLSSPVGISVMSAAAGSTVTWLHSQHGVIKDYEEAKDTIASQTKLIYQLLETNNSSNTTNDGLRDELRRQLNSTIKTKFKMHEIKNELQREKSATEELRSKLSTCESDKRAIQTAMNFSARVR